MNLYQRLYHDIIRRPTSWKSAACFNCIVLMCLALPVLVLTISTTKSHGLEKIFMFREGACNQISKINKGLHLVLNVVSSLVLASSNFFMQILNAPNRNEIDKAHKKGTWLEIGVPSIRNTFHVSRCKTFFWLVLLLSSIPIHLVFNSAIFQVDTIMGDYSMTVASEAFLSGAPYFVPGASLSQPWMDESNWAYWTRNKTLDIPEALGPVANPSPELVATYLTNASAAVNMGLLQHPETSWTRLSAEDCYQQYADSKCSGIKTHKDVVVILNEPLGWTRHETWSLTENETAF